MRRATIIVVTHIDVDYEDDHLIPAEVESLTKAVLAAGLETQRELHKEDGLVVVAHAVDYSCPVPATRYSPPLPGREQQLELLASRQAGALDRCRQLLTNQAQTFEGNVAWNAAHIVKDEAERLKIKPVDPIKT